MLEVCQNDSAAARCCGAVATKAKDPPPPPPRLGVPSAMTMTFSSLVVAHPTSFMAHRYAQPEERAERAECGSLRCSRQVEARACGLFQVSRSRGPPSALSGRHRRIARDLVRGHISLGNSPKPCQVMHVTSQAANVAGPPPLLLVLGEATGGAWECDASSCSLYPLGHGDCSSTPT